MGLNTLEFINSAFYFQTLPTMSNWKIKHLYELELAKNESYIVAKVFGQEERSKMEQTLDFLLIHCFSHSVPKLLIDIRELDCSEMDIDSLSILEVLIKHADNTKRIGLLHNPGDVNPLKISSLALRSRGMKAMSFTDAHIANKWIAA